LPLPSRKLLQTQKEQQAKADAQYMKENQNAEQQSKAPPTPLFLTVVRATKQALTHTCYISMSM
ncbi:MAG: hypothetical protein ACOX8T_13330, partial [Bacillota bacterium]